MHVTNTPYKTSQISYLLHPHSFLFSSSARDLSSTYNNSLFTALRNSLTFYRAPSLVRKDRVNAQVLVCWDRERIANYCWHADFTLGGTFRLCF